MSVLFPLFLFSFGLAVAGPRGVVKGGEEPFGRDRAYAPRRVALVFGIGTYVDPALGSLRYSVKDSQDMARILQAPEHGAFDLVSQVSGSVTRESFWSAFNAATGLLQRDDTFLLYFAGHGTLDLEADGTRLYLLPSDAWLAHPADAGIPLTAIEEAMESLPARRRVMVLDSCYSGGGRSRLDPGTEERIRGLRGPLPESAAVEVRESDVRLFAAHQHQPAMEDNGLENGVYTHFLVEALSGAGDVDGDGLVEVMEAHDWARDRTLEYTGGVQVPWVQSVVVGRESIWLSGNTSSRKRAERSLLEGLEALPAGAVLTVDGVTRGAGALEIGPRKIVVAQGDRTLLQTRIRARPGHRVQLGGLLEERRSQSLLLLSGAYSPDNVWLPSVNAGLQAWWLPADPSGLRPAWGFSVWAGTGDVPKMENVPNGFASVQAGLWGGHHLMLGPTLGLGGLWRIAWGKLQDAPALVPGLHAHYTGGPAVLAADATLLGFATPEPEFLPRVSASFGARF